VAETRINLAKPAIIGEKLQHWLIAIGKLNQSLA